MYANVCLNDAYFVFFTATNHFNLAFLFEFIMCVVYNIAFSHPRRTNAYWIHSRRISLKSRYNKHKNAKQDTSLIFLFLYLNSKLRFFFRCSGESWLRSVFAFLCIRLGLSTWNVYFFRSLNFIRLLGPTSHQCFLVFRFLTYSRKLKFMWSRRSLLISLLNLRGKAFMGRRWFDFKFPSSETSPVA